MQITRQADYALRTVLYLVRLGEEQRASTNQIAREQKIPTSFLAKIISQLSIAGILQTSRGARGGVSLTRSPEKITLLEVVEAIDGPIWLNDCVNDPSICMFGESCPLHRIWCKVQAELVQRLKNTTFQYILASGNSLE
jgi:Rrf2 family protein